MTSQTFAEDCVARLDELAQAGRVDRRTVLAGLAALGLGVARAPAAHAQARELVIVNFGGDAVGAMTKAWAEPYMKLPGALKAVVDGSGPTSAKMKAMVESGKVTWDAVDRNLPASVELGRQGLLEKIDYSI